MLKKNVFQFSILSTLFLYLSLRTKVLASWEETIAQGVNQDWNDNKTNEEQINYSTYSFINPLRKGTQSFIV